jgi:hypothetical protein
MAPAVAHIHLHGDTNTVTQATADLTAFLRRAQIDATATGTGEILAYLAYPLDPAAHAELEFALHAWQTGWPDITADVAAH